MRYFFLLFLSTALISCSVNPRPEQMEKWKSEIMEAEQAFNDLAEKQGLAVAFGTFAAKDGVIRRRGKVIKSPAAIRAWYEEDAQPGDTLSWKPDFIDVSKSGDLGYTYGGFTFKYLDSLGNQKVNTGTFHSVWKRQANGEWKFVWD